jgi:hypothetical protein
MRSRPSLFVTRLAGDEHGTSIIETAIIAPVLLMLLAGAVDFAMGFSSKLRTQQAAARAIEYATTVGVENLTVAALRAEAASAADVPLSQVEADRWLECSGTRQGTFEAACASGEEMARFVSVRIVDSYQPMLGSLLPARVAPNGSISFVGFSTVRIQ